MGCIGTRFVAGSRNSGLRIAILQRCKYLRTLVIYQRFWFIVFLRDTTHRLTENAAAGKTRAFVDRT